MPLYDFECQKCGKVFEGFSSIANRKEVRCECGGPTKVLVTCHRVDIFKPFWHEDISPDGPVYIKSKAHYKEMCKKYGVYAPHVFGQGWNLSEV